MMQIDDPEAIKICIEKQEERKLMETSLEKIPAAEKIIEIFQSKNIKIRDKLADKLIEGLESTKPVVVDGEIFAEKDYAVIHKYCETLLEVLGDKRPSLQTDMIMSVEELENRKKRLVMMVREIIR